MGRRASGAPRVISAGGRGRREAKTGGAPRDAGDHSALHSPAPWAPHSPLGPPHPMAADDPGPSGRDGGDGKRPASPAHAAPIAKRARVELPLPAHPTRARVPSPTSTSAFVVPDRPSPPICADDKVRAAGLQAGPPSSRLPTGDTISCERSGGRPRVHVDAPEAPCAIASTLLRAGPPAPAHHPDTPSHPPTGRSLCVRAG